MGLSEKSPETATAEDVMQGRELGDCAQPPGVSIVAVGRFVEIELREPVHVDNERKSLVRSKNDVAPVQWSCTCITYP